MQVNPNQYTPPTYSAGTSGGTSDTTSYLKTLREKFPDVNITVASINSDSQLKQYAMGHIGSFNSVTISKDMLEKMANDPATAEKYEKLISEMPEAFRKANEQLESQGTKVLGSGMNIGENGKVSYWGIGTSTTSAGSDRSTMTQRIQKDLEESITKKKEAQKQEELRQKKLDEKKMLEEDAEPRFFIEESANALHESMKSAGTKNNFTSDVGMDVKA